MLQEILLDVVSFVDYATLVMLKLSNQGLLRFVDRHGEMLAVRRTFMIECHADKFTVLNAIEWWLRERVVINANDTERRSALAELKAIIGPDVVKGIGFYEAKIPIRSLVDAIHAVRDTWDVFVNGPRSTTEKYVEDVCEFRRAERMTLYQIPLDMLIALMKHDCSSKMSWLSITPPLKEGKRVVHPDSKSELLRFCVDYDNLRDQDTKRIWLEYWSFRWTFVERLIEVE
ncbi:hypothetical protein AAVH_18609 [Aphelenchoides avenae]|nr:hypothetical protein AAVH_36540 [Aphelenchus avenae]KAH7714036.1 hypothetical protein AAVH_18609 [Aphelenchus avenae]